MSRQCGESPHDPSCPPPQFSLFSTSCISQLATAGGHNKTYFGILGRYWVVCDDETGGGETGHSAGAKLHLSAGRRLKPRRRCWRLRDDGLRAMGYLLRGQHDLVTRCEELSVGDGASHRFITAQPWVHSSGPALPEWTALLKHFSFLCQ